MNETNASAIESKPSAKRVRLPVVVDIVTSAIPIANRVQTDIYAVLFPSSKALDSVKKVDRVKIDVPLNYYYDNLSYGRIL
jgi:hypothetical protein